jgi:hypothetical protein
LCAIGFGALVKAHRSDRRARVFDAMGSSMRRVGFTVTAICAALAVLGLAPAARADTAGPAGCVGGWHSPAAGTLDLRVFATPAVGTTLASATLSVDGTPVASVALPAGTPACTDGSQPGVEGIALPLDTRPYLDGMYRLTVSVADSDGATTTVLDSPTEIWHPSPGSSTATLTIGSGVPAPPPGAGNPPGGGVLGAAAGSCVKPKLSMRLSQKPLRIRKGVPVLVKGKRYRFSGRLTCLVGGKRVSAPKRTRVELRQIVHGKSHLKGRALVAAHGALVARFSVPSSRTLEFRFTTADGKVTRVRIKVQVVKQRHKKG